LPRSVLSPYPQPRGSAATSIALCRATSGLHSVDAAIIANVLHDFSPEKAQTILRRVAEALPPGAPLLVMEMAPDDDRSGPPIPVAFALAMLVNTEGGDAYTVPQYRAWLKVTGFEVERVVPLGGRIVTTAICARRR
jgi:hypothetical protein